MYHNDLSANKDVLDDGPSARFVIRDCSTVRTMREVGALRCTEKLNVHVGDLTSEPSRARLREQGTCSFNLMLCSYAPA